MVCENDHLCDNQAHLTQHLERCLSPARPYRTPGIQDQPITSPDTESQAFPCDLRRIRTADTPFGWICFSQRA